MVKVLFFASIREQLGQRQTTVELPERPVTLADLKQLLIDRNEPLWAQVLLAENVVKAVNQQVVDDNHCVADGDEVAFFPPVTGG
jgi:molybdopterin converting factor subunit 1